MNEKKVIRKLNSERGAALSIALVLFLVCTVIGAIVLSSATTAAGRISDVKAADMRYYSVHSAEQVLKKSLNGQHFMIKRYETIDTTTTTNYQTVDHEVTTLSSNSVESKVYDAEMDSTYDGTFDGTTITTLTKDESLLAEAVMQLLFDSLGVYNCSDAFYKDFPAFTGSKTRTLNLTLSSSKLPTGATTNTKVTINTTLSDDGLLRIKLTSADGSKDKYSITLVFEAEYTDKTLTKDEGIISSENTPNATDDTYSTTVEVREVTNVRETEITWNFLRTEE